MGELAVELGEAHGTEVEGGAAVNDEPTRSRARTQHAEPHPLTDLVRDRLPR